MWEGLNEMWEWLNKRGEGWPGWLGRVGDVSMLDS
jgi:hypothetical protein